MDDNAVENSCSWCYWAREDKEEHAEREREGVIIIKHFNQWRASEEKKQSHAKQKQQQQLRIIIEVKSKGGVFVFSYGQEDDRLTMMPEH